jgi:hypothetical protein
VSPRTNLDNMEKTKILPLLELEIQPLSHPARSQSLCRLLYPGSLTDPFILLKWSVYITVIGHHFPKNLKVLTCLVTLLLITNLAHTVLFRYLSLSLIF